MSLNGKSVGVAFFIFWEAVRNDDDVTGEAAEVAALVLAGETVATAGVEE